MPYTMRKVPNKNCYRVSKKSGKKSKKGTRKVFSKCASRSNALKQMRLLRALEYNRDFVILNKNANSAYVISTVKDWIFLTKFFSAKILTKHPKGQLETIVDRKFVYNQNFELNSDLDFKFRYILEFRVKFV